MSDGGDRTGEIAALHQELADLAYAIAHDLASPLRAIGGFSTALSEEYAGLLDEEGRDYVGRIRSSAARMERMLAAFRKLAQVSRADLRRTEVDVTAIAESIAAELREAHPSREAAFSIQRDLTVSGDPALLRMAFEQLLENSWKFSRHHPRVTVEVGREENGGETVLFVRDEGAGFDPAYASKLFVPFQRLHSQAEFEGDGIGLAVVRRIVHRHGGRVWAVGAVEQGATFRMAFH